MAEEANAPNSDGKSPNKDAGGSRGAERVTDAGDVAAVICAAYCIIGAVWQAVDFWLLGKAQELIDALDYMGDFYFEDYYLGDISTLVVYVALMNIALWSAGAYFCWKVKNTERMTAGARALIAVTVVVAARLCVWLVSQQFYAVLAGNTLAMVIYGIICIQVSWGMACAILLVPILGVGWVVHKLRKWWISWINE